MTSIAKQTNPLAANYGDILFDSTGQLILVGYTQGTSQQEILQGIIETLSTYLGEWFMDNTIGIDFFNQVFVKNPSLSTINAIFLTALLNAPGVQQVNTYNFTPNFITRTLAVSFSVLTTNGVINYGGLIS